VVLSWHDTCGTPEDLAERAATLMAAPPRWIKMVPTTTGLGELERLLRLHALHNGGRPGTRRLITFGMGPVGSRAATWRPSWVRRWSSWPGTGRPPRHPGS